MAMPKTSGIFPLTGGGGHLARNWNNGRPAAGFKREMRFLGIVRGGTGLLATLEDARDVGFGEGLERADRVAVEAELRDERGDVLLLRAQLREGERHAEVAQPRAVAADALGGHRGGLPFRDAEHLRREPREAGEVDVLHVVHPRGHDHGEARAVRASVERRELVLDAVARPVLRAARAADVVVRERSGPHDVGARRVVARGGQRLAALRHDRAHEPLAQLVGDRDVARGGEVAGSNARRLVVQISSAT